jgi:hypothetical protein
MPRDMCPHYPGPTGPDGTTRCRACQQTMYASKTSEGQPKAEYPGVRAASGTALNAAKAGASIDGKHHN